MIDIKNLTITTNDGDRKLIDNLSFTVNDGDKLAIIGEEGNGKSTLVKAIACPSDVKKYAHIAGQINLFGQSIGYLQQILDHDWDDQQVYSYFLKESPLDEDDYSLFENFGEITKYVSSFGLNPIMLENGQSIGELSGGEKVKLQIIKILTKNPDILILDEPTNDLDIKTLEWLEGFINSYSNPIIYISHDEELLEKTANCILHVEQLKKKSVSKCTYAHLDYSSYIQKRFNDLEKQAQVAEYERAQDAAQMEKWRQIYNRVDHELNTISRKDPHGARLLKKKMQSVKSQEKRFERERKEFTERPDAEEAIYLNFGDGSIPNGKIVCDIHIPQLNVGDRILSQNINLRVIGPEHVVIVGRNGAGKTTFIKELSEHLQSRQDIKVGYMPQNYSDILSKYDSVLEYVAENVYDKDELTKIRTFLACLKFTGEEVGGKISDLSGGQKAKLFIAKLMTDDCNVLILDEPTRNLSPLSNPVIRNALTQFDGAIISVSHDRKFIKEVSTEIYEFTETGLKNVTNDFFLETESE